MSMLLLFLRRSIIEQYTSLSTVAPSPFSSPIPWRKSDVRYNRNEIYFDIVEELEGIIAR